VSEPAIWLVIASESIARGPASRVARRHGVQPLFARDLQSTHKLVGRARTAILAVLPPVIGPDCFALVASVRRRHPDLASVIVLGPGRVEQAPPRLLWSSPAPVPPIVVAAVSALAVLHVRPPSTPDWDTRSTAELPLFA
jgi:hypothetical protein